MDLTEQIGAFGDVPLDVEVELDRRQLAIREVLALETDSVLKLSRPAGENLDVRLGGVLIGYGEIVIPETTVNVRITDFNNQE